jgi:hypothetical protein
MKKYLYILLSIFGLFYMPSCKKENQRIGENTYELDSVAIGYLDTTGNYYYSRTITINPNFIAASIPSSSVYNGISGINFEERNDSILLSNHLDLFFSSSLSDYCYIVNRKFNSCYHKYLTSYSVDAYLHEYKQDIQYNSNGSLQTITNIQDNHFDKYDNFNSIVKRKVQQLFFSYAGKNLNNIDLNFYLNNYYDPGVPYDTSSYNQGEYIISYPNHYANQKNLIGFDVNDIILSSLLDMNYFNDLGYIRTIEFTGLFGQTQLYNLKIAEPFVLTKNATFNTNCENLIEHIHFNYTVTPEARLFHYPFNASADVNISYEFDTANNNRIKTMTIQTIPSELATLSWSYHTQNSQKLKYTFYYKD